MGHYMGVGSTSNISCATREICFNLFDLAQTILSVLHKELESKVEKLKYKKVGGPAAEDQEQIQTSSWWINYPGSVHMKFYSSDSLIIIKGEGRGA